MEFPPSNTTVGLVVSAVIFFFYVLPRLRRASLGDLPGPSPRSWLVGNLPDLYRQFSVGDTEFKWMREYGNAVKFKGGFGRDILFAADPKAVHHILNVSGYHYPKSPEFRALINRVNGHGLSWAQGAQHANQRKIMNPAFSYNSLRVFLPLFQYNIQKTLAKWRDLFAKEAKTSLVMDIHVWLSRTTLDIIGQSAFDYDFGAIDEGKDNKLAAIYNNLFADSFLEPPDAMLAMGELPGIVPAWVITAMDKLPDPALIRLREYMTTAKGVAKGLMDRQLQSHAAGREGGKDVMSILVKANISEDPKSKMTEDEILSQMTTMMLAGHETTANTVTFALYELSKQLDIQNALREEIKGVRMEAERRGDSELTIADLESMKLLGAVIKETLRVHPILSRVERMAGRDDVIPLANPITTGSGKVITSIPVQKGQRVFVSLAGYNRLESLWGADAHSWRPGRYLEGIEKTQQTSVGMVGNAPTFSSGVRSCIGWRFSMIELQALLVEIIENYEFTPAPEKIELRRAAVSLMFPLVDGRTQLPLTVTPVA